MPKITKIRAREILDSRGNPTVEVDVFTEKGLSRASVPSGASTGRYEALELRDNERRYLGKGVLKAVSNVNNIIAERVIGRDCTKQKEVDELMIDLDGTPNKSNLGANAILAVSMAVCKAGALESNLSLYEYIAKLVDSRAVTLPIPQMNVINGGVHAGIKNDFQEHMIIPLEAKTFSDALRMCSETYHTLKKNLKEKFGNSAIQVADEGGFVPPLKRIDERFEFILEAIEELGYEKIFALATDAASSEFYHNGKYRIMGKEYSSAELTDFYSELCEKFKLISIEDGLSEDDWDGWSRLNSELGKKIQIVGDDLLVTSVERIKKAIKLNLCNALLMKLNQIGTVTEALNAFKLAREAGWNIIVSHRSGSTEETFYADLVVGLDAGQFKYGAPARSERTANYNQLLRIEEELGGKAKYSKIFE
ncbi:phosphopyruvate hydratase [Candidatus Bathyarchaeota archaeon]|nr:phosphopyruvate hydratase [Candidatus Bathyarchaeota archaeon]